MPSVDIVVPCYRYGHYLQECVESALSQSLKSVRVLIIDDASPDNAREVGARLAQQDVRVTLVRHSENKGHIATYNEGIDWVSADYMLLLSADDYLLPGALERAAALLDAHPEVGFVFGRAIELSPDGSGTETEVFPTLGQKEAYVLIGRQYIELSGPRNKVPTPTAVVRTSLLKKVGGYSPELPHSGDMEMWLRLAANASVGILNSLQAIYRLHLNNMSLQYKSNKMLLDLEQRKKAINKFGNHCRNASNNMERLEDELLAQLAREMLSRASSAFNDREMDVSATLSALALETCPAIETSIPWLLLRWKRRIGHDRWRRVQPFAPIWRRWRNFG